MSRDNSPTRNPSPIQTRSRSARDKSQEGAMTQVMQMFMELKTSMDQMREDQARLLVEVKTISKAQGKRIETIHEEEESELSSTIVIEKDVIHCENEKKEKMVSFEGKSEKEKGEAIEKLNERKITSGVYREEKGEIEVKGEEKYLRESQTSTNPSYLDVLLTPNNCCSSLVCVSPLKDQIEVIVCHEEIAREQVEEHPRIEEEDQSLRHGNNSTKLDIGHNDHSLSAYVLPCMEKKFVDPFDGLCVFSWNSRLEVKLALLIPTITLKIVRNLNGSNDALHWKMNDGSLINVLELNGAYEMSVLRKNGYTMVVFDPGILSHT